MEEYTTEWPALPDDLVLGVVERSVCVPFYESTSMLKHRTCVLRHGRRKPCMLIPLLGEVLTALSLILCVYFKSLPMEIVAIAESILPAIAG